MSRPRAADDFTTIRARMEELRRERAITADEDGSAAGSAGTTIGGDAERRRRARIEGLPPPWVPTIFARRPRR